MLRNCNRSATNSPKLWIGFPNHKPTEHPWNVPVRAWSTGTHRNSQQINLTIILLSDWLNLLLGKCQKFQFPSAKETCSKITVRTLQKRQNLGWLVNRRKHTEYKKFIRKLSSLIQWNMRDGDKIEVKDSKHSRRVEVEPKITQAEEEGRKGQCVWFGERRRKKKKIKRLQQSR